MSLVNLEVLEAGGSRSRLAAPELADHPQEPLHPVTDPGGSTLPVARDHARLDVRVPRQEPHDGRTLPPRGGTTPT